jgi:hypothetical protein
MDDLIKSLKDVHLPPKPALWPLPMGYWLGLILIVLIISLYFLWRRKKKIKLGFLAFKELENIQKEFLENNDSKILQSRILALFRRLALAKSARKDFLRSDTAELLQLAHKRATKNDLDELSELLQKNRFQKETELNSQRLLELTKSWLRHV